MDDKKTISEYEKQFNTYIIGYQGFPEGSNKNSLMTEREFLNGCINSTLRLNPDLLWKIYLNYDYEVLK